MVCEPMHDSSIGSALRVFHWEDTLLLAGVSVVSSHRLVLLSLFGAACITAADTAPTSYIIQTVAGSDDSGDGGQALSAAFEPARRNRSGSLRQCLFRRCRRQSGAQDWGGRLHPNRRRHRYRRALRATVAPPVPRCSISPTAWRSIQPEISTSPTWETRGCEKSGPMAPSRPWPAEARYPPQAPDKAVQPPVRN